MMNLVYIYGPPGVGKLTVAKELAQQTGLRLFHNHLSIDCVKPVFDFGTEAFGKLVHQIRLSVLSEAGYQNTSVIFTFVYAHPADLPLVTKIFEAIGEQGGRVCPVQLLCSREEHERRVQSEDRLMLGRIASLEVLQQLQTTRDLLTPIPGRESLTIDNTHLAANAVAERIAAHYHL